VGLEQKAAAAVDAKSPPASTDRFQSWETMVRSPSSTVAKKQL